MLLEKKDQIYHQKIYKKLKKVEVGNYQNKEKITDVQKKILVNINLYQIRNFHYLIKN
jgi:hypothetical protein